MTSTWIKDFTASFVVFLVALPLSLGIAVASGAPVEAGLIAAICGGVIVGLLGGAPMQVSGPAAGLTVMVLGFVTHYGFKTLGVIIIIAGAMQVILGLLRVAKAALIISPAVLHAMLAGIGVLITLGQIHVLFGSTPKGSAWLNLENLPETILHTNPGAFLVGGVTLFTLIFWNRVLSKKIKNIPGSLVAILLGTLVSLLITGDIPRVKISESLFSGFSLPSVGDFSWLDIVESALALMIVASAESLLCAVATDQLHSGPRANLNRELFAQGVGNMASGFLGGLPMTGVIVRSSANITAGAQTRLSAILHGVWIALFVLLATPILKELPMAALAALLIHVGVNLLKLKEFKKIASFNESLIYLITLFGVVFINLLWGIGIGFGLTLLRYMIKSSNTDIEITPAENQENVLVKITGALSFLNVPDISEKFKQIPAGKKVVFEINVSQLDHAAVEAIRGWVAGYQRTGGHVDKPSLDLIWSQLSRRI